MILQRFLICLAAASMLEATPLAAQVRLPSSGIVKGFGRVYGVSGRQRVPRGKKLVLQQGVRLVGIGANAVLEVEGSLVVHGVPTSRIQLEGFLLEPKGDFGRIQFEWVDFVGGAGIATGPDLSARGDLTLTNTSFSEGAGVDIALWGGEVRMEQFEVDSWVRIEGVPRTADEPKGSKPFTAPVELQAGGCRFRDGLKLKALRKGVVRSSLLAGPSSEFFGCKELQLTDDRIESEVLTLGHDDAKLLGNAKLARCDIYAKQIRLVAPAASGKPRRLTFDGCWFSAGTKDDAVGEIITDHADDEAIGVLAKLSGLRDKPRFR